MSERISVVVASFGRPQRLSACLDGLHRQQRAPDEVIVIVSAADPETERLVDDRRVAWPVLHRVCTTRHGTVVAYNLGLEAASGTIVAYVDDDAVPEPDWLARIEATFQSDPRIAAVGGRDVLEPALLASTAAMRIPRRGSQLSVGEIQWWGRMTANHHVGGGGARDVDVLKGVNMSFRRAEVIDHGFDQRLHGEGAQVHSELSICLPLRRRGLRVVYDPHLVVQHRPAARKPGDERFAANRGAVRASAHNEALAILEYVSPLRRLVFVAWAVLVGHTEAPGLLALSRDLTVGRPRAMARFVAAQEGRWLACRTYRREPRPPRTNLLTTFT